MLPFCDRRCGNRVEHRGSHLCERCKSFEILTFDDDTTSLDVSYSETTNKYQDDNRKIKSTTTLNLDNKNAAVQRRGPTGVFKLLNKLKNNRSQDMTTHNLLERSSKDSAFKQFISVLKSNSYREIQDIFLEFISSIKSNPNLTSLEQSNMMKSFYLKTSVALLSIPEFSVIVENDQENMINCIERVLISKLYDTLFSKIKSESRDDHVFFNKVRLLSWVNENNLQLPSKITTLPNLIIKFCEAQMSIRKISQLRVPSDKLKCIKYCCLQLFAVMTECDCGITSNADVLIPLLIFFIIKTNPWNLMSEIQFITKFSQDKSLNQGQEGYCFTSFNAVISVIKELKGGSTFNITDEEYEKNINKVKTEADELIESINGKLENLKHIQASTWKKLVALKHLVGSS